MPKGLSRLHFVALIAATWSASTVASLAQTQRDAPAGAQESLRRFLQTLDDNKATRYVAAFPDLNSDGAPEAVVYLIGSNWCGSGGCNTLVLARDGTSWKVVTNITITRPPIRVLRSAANGWRSIGVWVQGGGIQPGYEAELRFDGKTYPRNPSIPPARRLAEKVKGEVVVLSPQDATALYPVAVGDKTGVPSSGLQVPRPSFDCTSAKTPTEALVCRDVDLASMDSAMAAAYRSALQQLQGDQAAALRHAQLNWFKQYARACDSAASDIERRECIVRYLGSRIQELKAQPP